MEGKKNLRGMLLPLFLSLIIILSIPVTAQAKTGTISFDPETGDMITTWWDHEAVPSSVTFKVDGTSVTIRTYEIDESDSIFVKVRDVASALKTTEKRFGLSVNKKKKSLSIKPGKSYTPIGGENKKSGSRSYEASTVLSLYNNSTKQSAKVYTINKEYYVALKTLAKIAGFSITKSEGKNGYLYKIVTVPTPASTPTPIPTPSPVFKDDSTGLIKNPFPNAKMISSPRTVDDCYNILAYLIVNNLMDYTFQTDISYTDALKEDGLSSLFVQAANPEKSPELFSGAVCHTDITFKENEAGTSVTVKFRGWGTQTGNTLAKLNLEYFSKAQAAVQLLIDRGKVTATMTETEKAFRAYKWVALNVFPVLDEFDETPRYMKENSPTGYAAIVDRNTTSKGYTALYNLMCRYLGLTNISAMMGTAWSTHPHMCTFQELDGKKVITDVTNGFTGEGGYGPEVTPNYFAMHTSQPNSEAKYFYLNWDKEKYAEYESNFEYLEITDDENDENWDNANFDNEDYFDFTE
jgi:hypothetical protein